jgi:hypothetical protein
MSLRQLSLQEFFARNTQQVSHRPLPGLQITDISDTKTSVLYFQDFIIYQIWNWDLDFLFHQKSIRLKNAAVDSIPVILLGSHDIIPFASAFADVRAAIDIP